MREFENAVLIDDFYPILKFSWHIGNLITLAHFLIPSFSHSQIPL
jgi:hypothetical protein